MDPKIWSHLPDELLEHILCFLPLKNFLNLRSTCKSFKSLIYSPSFMSKHSSASSFSAFLLLSHPQFHNQYFLYDSVLGTWCKLPLSLSLLLRHAPPCSTLLSASNGLFCFSPPYSSSFLICNLLAKSSRLIKFPNQPFAFELLTLVSTPSGYKIFMLFSNNAFVYNSKVHSWREFDGFGLILSDSDRQGGVCFNGHLYFVTPEPFSIVCFDLESGKWERSSIELADELTFVRLVSDAEQGKLYLIGGIGRNGISRSMKMWELGDSERGEERSGLKLKGCLK